jgi:hypothetical protein
LAVDAASREKMQFKVNAMGLDDKMAAIDQLKKNPKDPNRWMLGMLEEGVFKEKTAIAGFRAANAAAEKGEREEAEKQLQIGDRSLAASCTGKSCAMGFEKWLTHSHVRQGYEKRAESSCAVRHKFHANCSGE